MRITWAIVAFLTAASVAAASCGARELTNAQCGEIERIEAARGQPFSDYVVDNIHSVESCADKTSTQECRLPLRKRLHDYFVAIDVDGLHGDIGKSQAIERALALVSSEIEVATGIATYRDKKTKNYGALLIVSVDVNLHGSEMENFINYAIARPEFGLPIARRKTFDRFMNDSDTLCQVLVNSAADSEIKIASIWIKSSASIEQTSDCVVGNVFAGMGLDGADRRRRVADRSGGDLSAGHVLSITDTILLDILYDEKMRIGMSEDKTKSLVDRVIFSSCKR